MQLPPIPSSVRTSFAGFLAALFGWIALAPGVHPVVAGVCGFLSAAATGAGLHLAADHRAVVKATEGASRACATCGRPAIPPPPPPSAAETPLP
jgi:hypothetical protein